MRSAIGVTLLVAAAVAACDAPGRKPPPVVKESTVVRTLFDTTLGHKPVELFTLTNSLGMEVRAMSYGATILSIKVPDTKGVLANVVVGFDSLAGYVTQSPGLGAVLGRYAGHIANGRFTLDGKTYTVGTGHGFDKETWTPEIVQDDSIVGVAFNLVSPDGDQGFPGRVTVRVTYKLSTQRNELSIAYEGSAEQATPINLTSNMVFNLAGSGASNVPHHTFAFDADSSGNSNFLVIRRKDPGLVHFAHVTESTSGRTLDASTTEPGLPFVMGERTFTLAPQHFPDSPNHPTLPSTILRPGAVYHSQTMFSFGVSK